MNILDEAYVFNVICALPWMLSFVVTIKITLLQIATFHAIPPLTGQNFNQIW